MKYVTGNVNADFRLHTLISFENQTVKELKATCKANGIKGYSKLKKAELIELLYDVAIYGL